jgi:hypothetical protein
MKNKNRGIALIGQTTCYKERGVSGGEPNKTYEMRETLMEFLLVHVNLMFGECDLKTQNIRFFHVMFGDPSYSYSYFHRIRSKCYDLNVVFHPPEGVERLYTALESVLPERLLGDQTCALAALDEAIKSKKAPIVNQAVSTIKDSFAKYFEADFPQSYEGRIQAEAIRNLAEERNSKALTVSENLVAGIGIKQLYLEAARGAVESKGSDIKKVVDVVFEKRKFLPEAKKALGDEPRHWAKYVVEVMKISGVNDRDSLKRALRNLWDTNDVGRRELVRRVLIKLPGAVSGRGTAYPQDIPIKGVTEHNLYGKVFDEHTTDKLIEYLLAKFKDAKVKSCQDLRTALQSFGRPLVKSSFDYDVENGTVIRPVQYYVIQRLAENGYSIGKQKEILGSTIKGYHEKLFDIDIGPFNSIEVISDEEKQPVTLFKAKYFRSQEFDRRVKEEGFISFTSAFEVTRQSDKLVLRRRSQLPFVMFIDMDRGWTPEPEPIKQLIRMGWDVFFRINDLLDFLKSLKKRS